MAKRPVGRLRKRPLELSNGQAEADKPENIQAAPVVADGEEPSARSIRCQYTAKQKQRVVLYARRHGVRPAEATHVPQLTCIQIKEEDNTNHTQTA